MGTHQARIAVLYPQRESTAASGTEKAMNEAELKKRHKICKWSKRLLILVVMCVFVFVGQLCERGITRPEQLAIFGGSNSGLLVAVALEAAGVVFAVTTVVCILVAVIGCSALRGYQRRLVLKFGKAHVSEVLRTLDEMVNDRRYLGEHAEIVKEDVGLHFYAVERYRPTLEYSMDAASVRLLCRTTNGQWFRLSSIVDIEDSSITHNVTPMDEVEVRVELKTDLSLYQRHFGPPITA